MNIFVISEKNLMDDSHGFTKKDRWITRLLVWTILAIYKDGQLCPTLLITLL